jgi:hypothetical protein
MGVIEENPMDLPLCVLFLDMVIVLKADLPVPEGEKIGEAVGIPRKDACHVTEDNFIY